MVNERKRRRRRRRTRRLKKLDKYAGRAELGLQLAGGAAGLAGNPMAVPLEGAAFGIGAARRVGRLIAQLKKEKRQKRRRRRRQ